ncbi:MAG: hypothetical protein H8E66_27835 [Planctomycetes bacterium]|nr:hypothetical protein [Planctomycetota bacterium]
MKLKAASLSFVLVIATQIASAQEPEEPTQGQLDSQAAAQDAQMDCDGADDGCDQLRNWILQVIKANLDVRSDCLDEGATPAQLASGDTSDSLGDLGWQLGYQDLDDDAIPNKGFADTDFDAAEQDWMAEMYASAAGKYDSATFFYGEAEEWFNEAYLDFSDANGHYSDALSAYETLLMELVM